MHTLLDHDGYIPAFDAVTEARTHECRIAKTLELPKCSIVVFDKGFISYTWFRLLGEKGVSFVTRLKQNAVYKFLEHRPVDRKTGVTGEPPIAMFRQICAYLKWQEVGVIVAPHIHFSQDIDGRPEL